MKYARLFLFIMGMIAIVFSVGCGAPDPQESLSKDGGSEPCEGKLHCACYPNKTCDDGLVCRDNRCLDAAENIADAAPFDAPSIESSSKDEARRYCEPGTAACRCLPTSTCHRGLRCEDGICQVCELGTAGCACKKDNSCQGTLKCEEGICRGCVGKKNCPCYANNSCDKGLRCVVSASNIGFCKACHKGAMENCHCDVDKDCGPDLLCINKRCQPSQALQKIPANPKCYSPCQGDIRRKDGTLRICHPTYHLVSGCLVGQVCDQGSCIKSSLVGKIPANHYPYCQDSSDCPMWQTCLKGRCYSTCVGDAECASGYRCYRYVCRRKCQLQKNQCRKGESCANLGADEGVCLPKAIRYALNPPKRGLTGSFKVFNPSLQLSNRQTTAMIFFRNDSSFARDFILSRLSDDIHSPKPLNWLRFELCQRYSDDGKSCLAFSGHPSAAASFRIPAVPSHKVVIIRLSNAQGKPKNVAVYHGQLLLSGDGIGSQPIAINYYDKGDGQWRGTMVSFGNFEDQNIDKFPASSNVIIRDIPNALLRRWLNFKRQQISFSQFKAILTSIREGSWRLEKIQKDCKRLFSSVATDDVVCYPSNSSRGYEILSYSKREAPIPSGISELHFAMNVKENDHNQWIGRIDSTQTLHYPGNPEIKIIFEQKPGTSKLSFIKSIEATSVLGGRYVVSSSQACSGRGEEKVIIPWLIQGFEFRTWPDSGTGRQRYECRSKLYPKSIPNGASSNLKRLIERINLNLSAANPVPNGWSLQRKIELVDGALIDNRYLFFLYRERFISFFAQKNHDAHSLAKDFVQYGYILMSKTTTQLENEDYIGSRPPSPRSCRNDAACQNGEFCFAGRCRPQNLLPQVSCSPSLIKKALDRSISSAKDLQNWSSSQLENLIETLIDGQGQTQRTDKNNQIIGPLFAYKNSKGVWRYIHYFCVDGGFFDSGASKDGEACPVGSKVIFFESADRDLKREACNAKKNCAQRYEQLKRQPDFRENVPYRCEKPNEIFCDSNRKDLRQSKIFFKPSRQKAYISPYNAFRVDLIQAFRYRLKFLSRGGKNIGFTPAICPQNSHLVPYCYDPKEIEELEERVNCLEALYTDQKLVTKLSPKMKLKLKDFLTLTFAFRNKKLMNGQIGTEFGFETLNAELKIMLGDEAYIRAFSSRYDLANSQMASFQGDQFEPNGIILSGSLGFEMLQLYRSTQYYQMILDRFFAQSSVIYYSLQQNSQSFIDIDSVLSYFKKILLASTRKARSWGKIAEKYQKLNRSDIAKQVIERTYTAIYLEKVIITRLLRSIAKMINIKKLPQISEQIEKINLTYKSTFLKMEEIYKTLGEYYNFLGFQKDYLPFPPLSYSSANSESIDAFSVALRFAKEKMNIAKYKEKLAIGNKRQFDTDANLFQSELVRIERNYDTQLIRICGALKDGQRLVPAIPKYAYLAPPHLRTKNPCGYIAGGELYDNRIHLEKTRLNFESLKVAQENIHRRIQLEEKRIKRFCNARFELSQIAWEIQGKKVDYRIKMEENRLQIERTMRIMQGVIAFKEMWKCDEDEAICPFKAAAIASYAAATIYREVQISLLSKKLLANKKELAYLNRNLAKARINILCDICQPDASSDAKKCKDGVARIESQATLERLRIELLDQTLQSLQAEYDIRIALSRIKMLSQEARRLVALQQETEQMAINVQAARNDPNVRIYKNDAIITAERTFQDALKEAYRATLIYEYYTASSYKYKGDLYLIRMISAGDKNLEHYLSKLEDAYRAFIEQHGKPSHRLLILSLRDDILQIPKLAPDGTPRSLNDRVLELQKALTNPQHIDRQGYIAFPFSLSVSKNESQLSPITYNHKILYIEAEIIGGDIGDAVGRIYLRQQGTGVVRLPNDQLKFYPLPPRTAVLNPFFNGSKVFSHSIYKNYRFRDRPLGNTRWTLLLNMLSEKSNLDINLNSINDIKIYIYYTDFTL